MEDKIEKVNDQELEEVDGGTVGIRDDDLHLCDKYKIRPIKANLKGKKKRKKTESE